MSLLGPLPGLVRLGAGAYVRSVQWTAESTVHAGRRVLQAAADGESAQQLLEEAGQSARELAREVLGVSDVETRVRRMASSAAQTAATRVAPSAQPTAIPGPPPEVLDAQPPGRGRGGRGAGVPGDGAGQHPDALTLKERGAMLLHRSADVHDEQEGHPAYIRILDELAPDEARILRFLMQEGPQPAIDVRTLRPLDIGSQLIAPGIQMIGTQAGCRHLDRVPAYLNNLFRLGLIWFSREPLQDPLKYQVLEAQPEAIEALKKARRGKTVRRSIALTPFGEDFCRTCFPGRVAPQLTPETGVPGAG